MGTFQNLIGDKVLSPPAKLQFPNIAKPDVGGQYSDNKYKAHFLFSKTETEFGPMKKVVEDLSQLAFGCPAKQLDYVPFRDGDEKSHWQGFENSIFILSKSKNPVDVWSPKKDPATGELYRLDPDKFAYAGAIVRAHFASFAYMSGNARGITFILDFIQFLEDGPRFGGIGSIDARDIIAEYVPQSKRANVVAQSAASSPVEKDTKAEDLEPTEEAKAAEPAQSAPPAARKRGRPPTNATAEAPTTEEETPSQRAKREAAAARENDKTNGKSEVADLPVVSKPQTKSAGSLMDMM